MSIAIATATTIPTGTYAIDPTHSRVGFVARHAMVTKVRGSFNEFSGSGSFDAEGPTRLRASVGDSVVLTKTVSGRSVVRCNDAITASTWWASRTAMCTDSTLDQSIAFRSEPERPEPVSSRPSATRSRSRS